MEKKGGKEAEIGYVDYHFDPDAFKRGTYNHKFREDRKRDISAAEMEIYEYNVKQFFAQSFLGFILIVIGLATYGWFTSLQETPLLDANSQTMIRIVIWKSTLEGISYDHEYCPKVPEGYEATGEYACIPDKKGYHSFSDAEFWLACKGKMTGKLGTDTYGPAAAMAADASKNMIGGVIFNLLAAMFSTCVLIYGLYYKPNRHLCIFTLILMEVAVMLGLSTIYMFNKETQPLRTLIKEDNFYSADITPDMKIDFSFLLACAGTAFLSTSGYPFYNTIPDEDDKLDGSDLKAARVKEVNKRVRQYMADVTNTTHQDEVWTEELDPKKRDVPITEHRGDKSRLHAKAGSPMSKTNDFPMIQPGRRMEKPDAYESADSPPPFPPGSPLSPQSPTLGMPEGPPGLPGAPDEVPTMGDGDPKFDLMAAAANKKKGEAARFKKGPTPSIGTAPRMLLKDEIVNEEVGQRPVSRMRPVSRAPIPRDQRFGTNLAVGLNREGDFAGLISNYKPEIEINKATHEKGGGHR